ncbi:MAG TPA: cytochrome b [Acetobacteraceae bacterium]|nr:cytochrome b [Acetobacteraceae bacterium]
MNRSLMQHETLRYDSRTMWLHWLTALFILLAWGMAQVMDYFPSGGLRVDARSVHVTLGLAVGVVLALRLWHRIHGGRALEAADEGMLQALAKATHYILYVLVIAQVILGVMYVWSRGDSIFGLFRMPGGIDRATRQTIGDAHAFVAWCILGVAGFHAAAALFHHFVWRDGVLRRMLPRRA